MRDKRVHDCLTLGATGLLVASIAAAQPPGTVRYTEAREQTVERSVRLPGSVESRTESVVAAEAEGLVVALEVEEGDRVEVGHPLVRLRTIWYELQLRASQGRLKEAQARLELAASKLERARDLFDDEVVSQDQLDDAVSEFSAWQGREDQSEAEILQLELALDRCVIRAPFSGTIVRKRTELGQWVARGGPVAEMVSDRRLRVRVEVPERYFDATRTGVSAVVHFESLPGHRIDGRVDAIIPQADARARTFPITVGIPNDDGRVAAGMLAQVDLPLGGRTRAVVVPKDAVVRQGPMEVVFRIGEDDTVEPVPVKSGHGVGSWVVVEGPVTAGQRVVTRGNERLRPGQAVRAELLEYELP